MDMPSNGPRASFERTYAVDHWQDDDIALEQAWARAIKNGLVPVEVVSMREHWLGLHDQNDGEGPVPWWTTFVTLKVWKKEATRG